MIVDRIESLGYLRSAFGEFSNYFEFKKELYNFKADGRSLQTPPRELLESSQLASWLGFAVHFSNVAYTIFLLSARPRTLAAHASIIRYLICSLQNPRLAAGSL